jgi:hypothetical protein
MLLGYLAGLALIPRFSSQERYWSVSALLGMALAVGAFVTHGYVSVGFVAVLGFANAIMWPAIFPLAIRGLGRLTEIGSALLVMGITGGAIIPQAFAVLKQHYDFQAVFAALMVPCYLYVLYYAWHGHRVGLVADVSTGGARAEARVLGPDVDIEMEIYDECNTIVDIPAISKTILGDGGIAGDADSGSKQAGRMRHCLIFEGPLAKLMPHHFNSIIYHRQPINPCSHRIHPLVRIISAGPRWTKPCST